MSARQQQLLVLNIVHCLRLEHLNIVMQIFFGDSILARNASNIRLLCCL